MISDGEMLYKMKCAACHRFSDHLLVGPGFAGVTERPDPNWIMNMITNSEAMLDHCPETTGTMFNPDASSDGGR